LASRAGEPLIVVEDRGGTSALPYYEALNLQPRAGSPARPPIPTPRARHASGRSRDAAGAQRQAHARHRRAAGDRSARPAAVRGHRRRRGFAGLACSASAAALRERGAVGLVVNVETAQGLTRLRALVPGVPLAPVAGDDLADRLGLRHYPALITATGIEQ
jgi:hypothetical protein